MASVVPNITAAGWIKTAMIGALQVTDAEIADLDGVKLQAGTVPFTAADAAFQALVLGGQVYTASLTIPTADVKQLNTTPLDIVPTPGPGFKVWPVHVSGKIIWAGVAYNAGDEIAIRFAGATQPVISSVTLLQATVSRQEVFSDIPTIGAADTQIIPNAALQVWSPANPTLGTSDVIVTVMYMILPD